MLQPRTYPEMLGKALVLEAEPFATMTDDDNPWVEGLFFIACLGVLVGFAQFLGGILLTASLPPVEALREAVLILFRQLFTYSAVPPIDLQNAETLIRQSWGWAAFTTGYGGGWARLALIVLMPTLLIIIWLLYSGISFVAARWLGGHGTLNQTLGVTALMFAPQILLVLTIIPFVSIGWHLLWVWALLISFRGLEVAHDLSWQRSVLAALAAPALLLLIIAAAAIIFGFMSLIGGIL